MNILKYSIAFLLGAGVGVGGSFIFFTRKADKIRKEHDKELNEMDEYYRKKYSVEVEEEEEESFEEVPDKPVKKPEPRKGSFGTPYGDYYNEKKEDPASKEHPEDDERVEHWQKPPYLIRSNMFGENGYSERVLYYYTLDDALVPEENTYDAIIDTDEVKDMLGDALIKFGFSDEANLEREIYVRNPNRKTDYRIIKVIGSLSDDVEGE